jgi:hypothetical protein
MRAQREGEQQQQRDEDRWKSRFASGCRCFVQCLTLCLGYGSSCGAVNRTGRVLEQSDRDECATGRGTAGQPGYVRSQRERRTWVVGFLRHRLSMVIWWHPFPAALINRAEVGTKPELPSGFDAPDDH